MSPLEILGISIKRLQHRSHRTLDAHLAPMGISLVQWNALREIKQHPGLSMHRLAECTFNSDQAFGTLVTRLQRQKLVERQSGAGRTNLHRLTPRGEALLIEGHRCLEQTLAKIFAPLNTDEHALLQGLLNKALGSDDLAAPLCPLSTHLTKTTARLAPNPGQAIVRAGGVVAKPAPSRKGRVR